MQDVTRKLVIDLRIEEAKARLQDKAEQVMKAFGEDFMEEFTALMATLVGIEILGDPDNPLVQTCQEQEKTLLLQQKQIADAEKSHTRALSEISNMRGCISTVRKMAKELREGMLKETNRLCDKSEPTATEALLLNCEQKLKDILIRTKGVC